MKVSILVGNIASGKSTWADKYPDAFVLSKDKLRYDYGGGKYVFDSYLEGTIDSVIKLSYDAVLYQQFQHIIIDETNMTKDIRAFYIMLAKKYGYTVEVIVFPDLGEDIHVKKRLQNNHGDVSEETWRKVYQDNLALYDVPSFTEGFDNIIWTTGMMKNIVEDLEKFRNYNKKSNFKIDKKSRCYFCGKIIENSELFEIEKDGYIMWDKNGIAFCPYCNVDALLPEHLDYDIFDDVFIKEMALYWFNEYHIIKD